MLNNIQYEKKLWGQGIKYVAGVDEVGRGCFAGPIVTGAVIWSEQITTWEKTEPQKYQLLMQITDSKKLSEKKRDILSEFILQNALATNIFEISPKEIDQYGVGEANKKALRMVVIELERKYSAQKIQVGHVLIDHFSIFDQNNGEYPETSIAKGEMHSISIASASIIAKVFRDNLMKTTYHSKFPQYRFDKNVGYGTKEHRDAIKKYGITEIHRKSFRIKSF